MGQFSLIVPQLLVVDDDEVFQLIITNALLDRDIAVDTASSADEALRKHQARRYDLIMLDLQLPDISGVELARRFGDTPLLFVTSKQEESQLLAALAQQHQMIVGVAIKPIEPDRIETTVRSALKLGYEMRARRAAYRDLASRFDNQMRRVARELHDGIGSEMVAIRMDAKQIASVIDNEEARQLAKRIQAGANTILAKSSLLINDLRSELVDALHFPDALRKLIAEWNARRPQVRFYLVFKGEDKVLNEEQGTDVFRIVQEALTNIAKHAQGVTEARVGLTVTDGEIQLEITDDGEGLPGDWNILETRGQLGITERAASWDGTARIENHLDGGVLVDVRLPRRSPDA